MMLMMTINSADQETIAWVACEPYQGQLNIETSPDPIYKLSIVPVFHQITDCT